MNASTAAPRLDRSAGALPPNLQPLRAWRAIHALIRNPQDTRQAFVVTEALRGRSGLWMLNRFSRSPGGAEVIARRLSLLDTLQDRARLDALPVGTLGRAYAEFMGAENLTADGLVEASQTEEQRTASADGLLLRERMRDMHDLFHVMTGYGRDVMGELCVLAFTFAQNRNPGLGLLVVMGAANAWKVLKTPLVWQAVWEAWRRGRRAAWFPGQVWEGLMDRPLDELRRTLRVRPARRYGALLQVLKAYRDSRVAPFATV